MTTKTSKKGSKTILTILIIVFALIFCFSAYKLISYFWEGYKAEKAIDEIRDIPGAVESDSYEELLKAYQKVYEKNNDFVGWLSVYNTDIDYPVLQTPEDPEYYLRKDFDGNYSLAGQIFASDLSDIEKPSDVIILYGHNMKNGSMFAELKNYTKSEFYEDHRYIRFDTMRDRRTYEVIDVFITSATVTRGPDGESIPSGFAYYSYSDFDDEEDFDDFMSKVKDEALYDTGRTAEYGDELIMLSTCEYTHEDGRLVVLAKRISEEDAPNFTGH